MNGWNEWKMNQSNQRLEYAWMNGINRIDRKTSEMNKMDEWKE